MWNLVDKEHATEDSRDGMVTAGLGRKHSLPKDEPSQRIQLGFVKQQGHPSASQTLKQKEEIPLLPERGLGA